MQILVSRSNCVGNLWFQNLVHVVILLVLTSQVFGGFFFVFFIDQLPTLDYRLWIRRGKT